MAEKWTAAQRLAIDARDGSVLVSAAAGSGKTSVLVERILSLITDPAHPVPADRFLAVTFTNAAAGGVAARLRAALEKKIAAAPNDRFLRRQNLLLRRASVSTVHAFCASLLREHASALGIPLDFTVCDGLAAASLRESALARIVTELYADEGSGLREFSDLFGRSRSDAATPEIIEKLYDFECNLAFPEKWEAMCLAQAREVSFEKTETGRFLLSYAADALRSARALCVAALELCADDETLTRAYAPAIESDLETVNALTALCAAGHWDDAVGALAAYAPARLGAARGAQGTQKARAKELRDTVKGILTDLRDGCFSDTAASCAGDGALTAPVFISADRRGDRALP